MSCDTESHRLPDDQEFTKRSVDQDSNICGATSQERSNVVKCESALTSTDNDENDRLLAVPEIGNAETEENDKCEADEAISIIDKETRSNLEVKFLSFLHFLPIFSIRLVFPIFFFERIFFFSKFRYINHS